MLIHLVSGSCFVSWTTGKLSNGCWRVEVGLLVYLVNGTGKLNIIGWSAEVRLAGLLS